MPKLDSLQYALGRRYVGEPLKLDWVQVAARIRDTFRSKGEMQRVARHRRRQELYQDGGDSYMQEMITRVFKDDEIKRMREDVVSYTKYNNFSRRIISAMSTVYQQPALRIVGGQKQNKAYQEVQKLARQTERSRQWNRLGNLHKTLFVGVRTRRANGGGDERVPWLDVITPAQVWAVMTSPTDPLRPEAIVIELAGHGNKGPAAIVWTNHERFYITKDGEIIDGTIEEHGFSRMPIVMLSLEPQVGSIWPGLTGEDIPAAHMAAWFAEICLVKEMKSATKILHLSGDLTSATRGQAVDTERPVELPEGTASTVYDMSMDLSMFRDTSNHISDSGAAGHGVAPAVLRHQGVQSAEARDLMRVPIRELRLEQHAPLREFERELAEVQAEVYSKEIPRLEFNTDGWRIDFADPQTPLTVGEQLDQLIKAKRMNVDSVQKYLMRRNPDLTEEQARDLLISNITDQLEHEVLRRPINMVQGTINSNGASTVPKPVEQADDEPTQTVETSAAGTSGEETQH